ncbi:hypothetical protein PIB30_069209 [Stylosanthes scabra]|uniref:Uncharacterized protein n=1 Tax=Stylosanthes scabra TaxID=79078 RepID=A0ABU6TMT7_9FABA|nr:hypothetical protein [Stylosanthes scabra]
MKPGEGLQYQPMRDNGGVWADISRLPQSEPEAFTVFQEGLRMELGDGSRTKLWCHMWVKEEGRTELELDA